jgi:vitamin B12 transporter
MKQQDNRWIARLLAASVMGTALLGTPDSGAAEQIQVAMAAPSDEDLLMFWEEKELYVQTATRSEKPITQVAENMTVITAKEIEAMNATSISEVLARVPGVFLDIAYNDFNNSGALHIQGSEDRHVTVLLDGMPLNFVSGGNAITSFVPLQIVDRIEIIKGAASSAWGSALGGVINIITRGTGDKDTPGGMLSGSWGEGSSNDLATNLSGKAGPLGYYLYGGNQASNGLRHDRSYQRKAVFGKFALNPNRDLDITLSAGFSETDESSGDVPELGVKSTMGLRALLLNSAVEYRATPELTLRGGLHLTQFRNDLPTYFLADDALFKQLLYVEKSIGANLRATWSSGIQTLTVGGEASHGSMDQNTNSGPLYQSYGVPATFAVSPTVDRWGAFANDTVEFGPLAVTPGIRLDHDSITGYFVSPSLGLTWELGEHTVARASAARGFTTPPLALTSGQGLFYLPNPKLKAEYGWSYQVGCESGLADLVNLKGTLFRHETKKALSQERIPDNAPYSTMYNRDDIIRQGYELEADTVPFYNLSLKLGHAYAHVKGETVLSGYANPYYDTYSWLVGIKYDDRSSFSAQLNGSYIWWDYPPLPPVNTAPRYDTFIWDLTATKKFQIDSRNTLETFLTVHNLFSGAHYTMSAFPNATRWVEGGLRLKF